MNRSNLLNMLITHFNTKTELYDYALDKIKTSVLLNTSKYQSTSLFLSGGSTINLSQTIAQDSEINPKFVELFQVDERYVPNTDPDSNQKQLLEIFEKYPKESKNFFNTILSIEESLNTYETKLKSINQPDFMILGFGLDGHFGSVFASLDNSNFDSKELVLNTQAKLPYPVLERLTLSPCYISKAKKIFVTLIGSQKKAILEEFLGGNKTILEFPAKFFLEAQNIELLTCFE